MPSEVKLPSLGEGVASADVVDVKVKVGAQVDKGQPLIEIESEKASAEVPSTVAGKITEVLVKKGDQVKSGQTIVKIEASDGKAAPEKEESGEEAKEATKDQAKKEQPKKDEREQEEPKEEEPKKPVRRAPAQRQEDGEVHAGPATRRFARDFNVDLAQVSGSGPQGRVTEDDVKEHLRNLATGGGAGGGIKVPPLPDFEKWGSIETKPFESIRKRTAEHVSLSWNLIPHVTHHDLADVTDIEAFRKQHEARGGAKLTVTAFVVKACALLLKQHPQFNASLDIANQQIIEKSYYHIGIAVDTERGLVVPKLRDADAKSIHDIAQQMAEIAERARQKKLTADDMQGGTFTISNLGGIGGIGFSPIINWPEVAILGLSRSRMQPMWKDGQWIPRLLLPMSLSYDHRVIDGADAARFCRQLAQMLENPLEMVLHA